MGKACEKESRIMKIQQPSRNRLSAWISQAFRTAIALSVIVLTTTSASIIASDNFNDYFAGLSLNGQGCCLTVAGRVSSSLKAMSGCLSRSQYSAL